MGGETQGRKKNAQDRAATARKRERQLEGTAAECRMSKFKEQVSSPQGAKIRKGGKKQLPGVLEALER